MSHALLSPSSADRWIHCPPSALINAEAPRTDTVYTREGTLAHEVAELKARRRFLDMTPQKYAAQMKIKKKAVLWQDEMDGYTDTYLDALQDIAAAYAAPPHVAIEQRVDFSGYVPDGYGTADCIMIGAIDGIQGDVLNVIDFKYGKGVAVAAESNPQMMLYALGALESYMGIYDLFTVRMTIVQPRIRSEPDTWEMEARDLLRWAEHTVRPAAKLAAEGTGDFSPGPWCKFCAIRGSCRERAADNLGLLQFEFGKPPTLTDAEVGHALTMGAQLKAWLSDLEEYALKSCLDGAVIPGYKAVAGRSVRAWTDPAAAFRAALAAGIPEETLYERKPVTLAALEKAIGKKDFTGILGGFVQTPPGKPALVKDSDRRPAISNRTTAKDDFFEEV